MTLADNTFDLDALNRRFDGHEAQAIVSWAAETFGDRLVMTSSFGVQSALMLHLVKQVAPRITVAWVDTGYNFPQTYQFAQDLQRRLDLNLRVVQSPLSPARMEALYGKLWEQGREGLDRYDRIRKIEPRDRAFEDLRVAAWLSGPRRDQTEYRKTMRVIEDFGGVLKIHPILDWSSGQVDAYLTKHDLPRHPLRDKGYASIGDWHSTVPATASSDERAGRFLGLKQECGLHLPQTDQENQSRDSSGL
jgi:phosphoadenosine phosphosulfate reductase